jgi:AcrR family transcriptional regulator
MAPDSGSVTAPATAPFKVRALAGAAPVPVTATSRRDRVREETLADIKAAARKLLAEQGPAGVQLRPVAREVGLTAPALYRYVDSLEALIELVCVDCFQELGDAMEAARDAVPDAPVMPRLMDTARAFRAWAVAHPAEFGLVFGTPVQSPQDADSPTEAEEGAARFGNIFSALFIELWATQPFKIYTDDELAPGLAAGIQPFSTWLCHFVGTDIPKGALVSFIEAWIRLHGAVALETFGHLHWALEDGSPLFEQTLSEIGKTWTAPA